MEQFAPESFFPTLHASEHCRPQEAPKGLKLTPLSLLAMQLSRRLVSRVFFTAPSLLYVTVHLHYFPVSPLFLRNRCPTPLVLDLQLTGPVVHSSAYFLRPIIPDNTCISCSSSLQSISSPSPVPQIPSFILPSVYFPRCTHIHIFPCYPPAIYLFHTVSSLRKGVYSPKAIFLHTVLFRFPGWT